MYDHDSKVRKPGEADFADLHGLDRQRFYNSPCLAWGADPKLYDFAKDLGKLPEGRPEGCAAEYERVEGPACGRWGRISPGSDVAQPYR